MICATCGKANPDEARFCIECGTRVEPAPATPALPVSFVNGRYQVQRLLGEGGKKRVYQVLDTNLDREVAFSLIKREGLDAIGKERVEREAKLLGSLDGHPHIVAIHERGETDEGEPYLVSELMRGGDLERFLAQLPDHRPPLADTIRIADQVCQALAHAHEQGVVHRDLKPANIWLARDGTAKLGDFGLAMAVDKSRLSIVGTIVGTAGYMSPEQAVGKTPDARSDLYSLGAILYELVTGRPPFLGDDPYAVIGLHVNEVPVAPSWHNPDLPDAFEALILHLLAKRPEHRPATAETVRQQLSAIGASLGESTGGAGQHRDPAHTNPLDRLAGGIFVGREQELGQLRRAFDAANADRMGIVLLAGEPGIGKTALAEETVTYGRLLGAQVLWGRCYEWEGAPAYWPWVQIIRGYVHSRDAPQLQTDLGSGAVAIAQVVSEVRDRLPDLPQLPRMEIEQARFRLFDSIATFLRNAARRDPLLLVLDDIHWADTPSLLLLQFIARDLDRARILIIGTYRDVEVGRRHPLTATLADLSRTHRMQRIGLHGLTTADIARLIVLSSGTEPAPPLVEAIQRETEGNPFFVSEVVRLLVTEGRLGRAPMSKTWSFGIPQSVRDVVGRRLDQLSPACNEVLALASVVGRSFALQVLDRVCERSLEEVLEALEEAVHARLIDREATTDSYRFTHALVQETLADELSAGQRLKFHANVGQALEHLYAANLAPHYGEIAHHFAAAAPAGHAAKAVAYAVKVGDRAMSQFAWEAAAQHYERALQAMDLQAESDQTERCDVLLALGGAQYRTVLDVSESPAGSQAFLQAADLAKALGSPDRLARAALGFAGINVVRTPGGLTQLGLLEDALTLCPEGDSPLTARLLARLAVDARIAPNSSDRISALSDAALAMARRIGDPSVLGFVLVARQTALWSPDNLDDRIALATEAAHCAEAEGDIIQTLWAAMFSLTNCYEVGDRAGMDRSCQRIYDAAKRSGMSYFAWVGALTRICQAIHSGRFADADASVLTVGGDSQALVALYYRTLLIFLLRRAQGQHAGVEESLQVVAHLAQEHVSPFDRHRGNLAALARVIVLAETGRAEEARTEFAGFAGQRFPALARDSYWLATLVLFADACVVLGDRSYGAAVYEQLLPYAARNAVAGSGLLYFGAVSGYLGPLAALVGRRAQAAEHCEAAVAMNAQMGAVPFLTRSRVAYAHVLLDGGTATDWSSAALLLEQAQTTADELGMARLAEDSAELRRRFALDRQLGSAKAPGQFGLTERELEVLLLLADRRTNADIAASLFISPSTARTHVDHILGKLGVHSRIEAVDLARASGLLPDQAASIRMGVPLHGQNRR